MPAAISPAYPAFKISPKPAQTSWMKIFRCIYYFPYIYVPFLKFSTSYLVYIRQRLQCFWIWANCTLKLQIEEQLFTIEVQFFMEEKFNVKLFIISSVRAQFFMSEDLRKRREKWSQTSHAEISNCKVWCFVFLIALTLIPGREFFYRAEMELPAITEILSIQL